MTGVEFSSGFFNTAVQNTCFAEKVDRARPKLSALEWSLDFGFDNLFNSLLYPFSCSLCAYVFLT